jgi:transposase
MDEAESGRLVIRIERRGVRRYSCSGCGRRTGRVRSTRERTWDDLPWAAHHVTLVYAQRRLICRSCGIRTERIEFADPKARVSRRLRQQIGVDCQSMPTSHAAVRHGVSWDKARRAEKAFLAQWDRTRVKRQPRHIGLDEIQRGKGQRFWTVLSDVVHGEVIGLRHDRSEGAATALLTEDLTGRQRGAIAAVCTDMHRALSMQSASGYRRRRSLSTNFMCSSTRVRRSMKSAAKNSSALARSCASTAAPSGGCCYAGGRQFAAELQALFAANRRLFKAYVLREQLDRLWTYKTRPGVLNFLMGWFKALRWQRLPEMEQLGDFLLKHIEGIAADCDHRVRFGVVESVNTTIKDVLRRAPRHARRRDAAAEIEVGDRPPHSIRSRLDVVLERSTVYSSP